MSPSSCDEFARCLHELIPPHRLCPRHRRPSLFVMDQEYLTKLERRVTSAMEAALQHDKFVSPLEVLVGIGWLSRSSIEAWKHARVACLEQASAVPTEKLALVLEVLDRHATRQGLIPVESLYVAASRDRSQLHFSSGGNGSLERAYRTHWFSPEVSVTKRDRITHRTSRAPDLVVISALQAWTCTICGETGSLLFMEGDGPLCLSCADMDHLVFLPAGDAALSRRAKKASRLCAVVVRFSRSRKRYERQGVLVEEAALADAERLCLADEDAGARRAARDRERRSEEDGKLRDIWAREISRLFPSCPAWRAARISSHAVERGSGRVGRSAAGRAVDERAVRSAVVASIRHEDTDYDELLMSGTERAVAREQVRRSVDEVLERWRSVP